MKNDCGRTEIPLLKWVLDFHFSALEMSMRTMSSTPPSKEDDDTATTLHSHSFQLLSSLLDWYVIAWHTGRSVVSGVSSEDHQNWYFSETSLPITDQLRPTYPIIFFKWRRVSPVNVSQQDKTRRLKPTNKRSRVTEDTCHPLISPGGSITSDYWPEGVSLTFPQVLCVI